MPANGAPAQPQRDPLALVLQLAYLLEPDRLRVIHGEALDPLLDVRHFEPQRPVFQLVCHRSPARRAPLVKCVPGDAKNLKYEIAEREFWAALASIHRGGDVKRQIDQEFRDWNIFGGVLVDRLSDGRVESIYRRSL